MAAKKQPNPRQRGENRTPTDNPRHEALARCLAKGMNQHEAYVAAGYSPKGAKGAVSALLKQQPWIRDRVNEIQSDERTCLERVRPDLLPIPTYTALAALAIDKERVLNELWDNAMKAKGSAPYVVPDPETKQDRHVYKIDITASNAALIAIGREMGMFADKGNNAPQSARVFDAAKLSDEQLALLEGAIDELE